MEYKQTFDGMLTLCVTGLKKQFGNWSPVYITEYMPGTSPDHQCVYIYNESASGKITSVKYNWPQSKEQGGGGDENFRELSPTKYRCRKYP